MEQFIMNTKIFVGKDSVNELENIDMNRVYIVCDPFMEKSGMVNTITDILETRHLQYKIFSKVVPDPTIQVVSESLAQAKEFAPDTIIAFGGGSSIDTAKAVSYSYESLNKDNKITLIAIPTTSGTGSEVTSFSVISDPSINEKFPLIDDNLVPNIAILDPMFTVSVPKSITADTGMDVLTHALEAYVSTKATAFTDSFAQKAVQLVFSNLQRAVEKPDDIEARTNMMNASCMAGIAFNLASLGICHSMAHNLGAYFHLPHGKCNAVLLPHIVKFNSSKSHEDDYAMRKYSQIASVLKFGEENSKMAVISLVRQINVLMKKIGIPKYIDELVDVEKYKQSVEDMSIKALKDSCTETNPVQPTKEEIEKLYAELIKGGIR